jgi:hypothetical protein
MFSPSTLDTRPARTAVPGITISAWKPVSPIYKDAVQSAFCWKAHKQMSMGCGGGRNELLVLVRNETLPIGKGMVTPKLCNLLVIMKMVMKLGVSFVWMKCKSDSRVSTFLIDSIYRGSQTIICRSASISSRMHGKADTRRGRRNFQQQQDL